VITVKRGDIVVNRSGNEFVVDGVVYLDSPEMEEKEKARPKTPGLETPARKSYFTIFSERAMQTLNGKYYEDALTSGLLTPTGKTFDLEALEEKEAAKRAEVRKGQKSQKIDALRAAGEDSGATNADPVDPATPKVAKESSYEDLKRLAAAVAPVSPDCPDCAAIWNPNGGECKLCHYVPKVSKFTPLNTQIRIHSKRHHLKDHK